MILSLLERGFIGLECSLKGRVGRIDRVFVPCVSEKPWNLLQYGIHAEAMLIAIEDSPNK